MCLWEVLVGFAKTPHDSLITREAGSDLGDGGVLDRKDMVVVEIALAVTLEMPCICSSPPRDPPKEVTIWLHRRQMVYRWSKIAGAKEGSLIGCSGRRELR